MGLLTESPSFWCYVVITLCVIRPLACPSSFYSINRNGVRTIVCPLCRNRCLYTRNASRHVPFSFLWFLKFFFPSFFTFLNHIHVLASRISIVYVSRDHSWPNFPSSGYPIVFFSSKKTGWGSLRGVDFLEWIFAL